MNPENTVNGAKGGTGRVSTASLTMLAALVLAMAGCGRGNEKVEVRTVAVARTARTNLSNSMTFQGEFTPFRT